MATVNKDFRVKNGLQVNGTGSFGGAVVVGSPTIDTHAATKLYVDDSLANFAISSYESAPESAVSGQLYLDSLTGRISFFADNQWVTLATMNDTIDLPQHIHDNAIDGTGFIVSQYQDAGYYNDASSTPVDAGSYNTNAWTITWDGGFAIDNFN